MMLRGSRLLRARAVLRHPKPGAACEAAWTTVRFSAAMLFGYGAAALVSVAALSFPMDVVQASIAGMMLSFIALPGVAILVFAVRDIHKLVLFLTAILVPLAVMAWLGWQRSAM